MSSSTEAPPYTRAAISIARGASIGAFIGVAFHAIAGGGLRALGRKSLTPAIVGTEVSGRAGSAGLCCESPVPLQPSKQAKLVFVSVAYLLFLRV